MIEEYLDAAGHRSELSSPLFRYAEKRAPEKKLRVGDDAKLQTNILALVTADGKQAYVVKGMEGAARALAESRLKDASRTNDYVRVQTFRSIPRLSRAVKALPLERGVQTISTNAACQPNPYSDIACHAVTNDLGTVYWEKTVYDAKYLCGTSAGNTCTQIVAAYYTVSRYKTEADCTASLGSIYSKTTDGLICSEK